MHSISLGKLTTERSSGSEEGEVAVSIETPTCCLH